MPDTLIVVVVITQSQTDKDNNWFIMVSPYFKTSMDK